MKNTPIRELTGEELEFVGGGDTATVEPATSGGFWATVSGIIRSLSSDTTIQAPLASGTRG